MMSICLFTKVKRQRDMLVLGWVTTWCTSCVSDGFAAHASRPKSLSALFFLILRYKRTSKVISLKIIDFCVITNHMWLVLQEIESIHG